MTGVVIAGVLGLTALLVVGIILSRATTRQKQQAVASLEAERKAIGTVSILDLVQEEVEDLGLREIAGTDDVAPDILLRAWNDAPERIRTAERSDIRLTIRPDADPERLDIGDARYVLAGEDPPTKASDARVTPDSDLDDDPRAGDSGSDGGAPDHA